MNNTDKTVMSGNLYLFKLNFNKIKKLIPRLAKISF